MKRFNWLAAGRRWRKTTLGLHPVTHAALDGHTVIWGAPTYDQVRIGMDELKKAWGGYAVFNMGRMKAELPNGGMVLFRSLDNADNVRGHTADGVIIDEAGFIKENAWTEVLRPMLMDTGGWLLAKGTPSGRNWFWREWMAAQWRDDSARWQIPTTGVKIGPAGLERDPHPYENPYISFDEVKQLYETTPERIFQQEYLAAFVEDAGGVFRRVMDATTATIQDGAIPLHDYVFGVDWGKSNDFTVITVIDTYLNSLVYLDRFNQIDYTVQTNRLLALAERFRPGMILAESNSMGEPLIENLRRMGLPVQPFMTTNASKAQAIDALALAFERGTISIPNDQILISELQAYEMERLPSGMMRYNAPAGMHDDCVMSLAIGWHGATIPMTTGMRQGKVAGRGVARSGRGRATAVRRNV